MIIAALKDCWHPVAYSTGIGVEPVPVRLLDEPLVLHGAGTQIRSPKRADEVSSGHTGLDVVFGWKRRGQPRVVENHLRELQAGSRLRFSRLPGGARLGLNAFLHIDGHWLLDCPGIKRPTGSIVSQTP